MNSRQRSLLIWALTTSLSSVLLSQACAPGFNALSSHSLNSGSYTVTHLGDSLGSWDDSFPPPVHDATCMTDSKYNLCLTYKDPVTAAGGALTPTFAPQSATTAQQSAVFSYGLRVPKKGPLTNSQFTIDTTGFTPVAATVYADWKFDYNADTNHNMAQVQSFFWLNRERQYFLERTGVFYASTNLTGRKVIIRPYQKQGTSDNANNAFYSANDNSVTYGYILPKDNNTLGEVALDIAAVTHELGHANLFAASPGTLSPQNAQNCAGSSSSYCCIDAKGCILGIHEGVGDFHAKLMFPDKDGSIGDFIENSLAGVPGRNLETIVSSSQTAASLFASQSGEIHSVGAVYASIWYGAWQRAKARSSEQKIELLFSQHLAGLSQSDNFITAYATIKATAAQIFTAADASLILSDFRIEYQRLGLSVQ